MSCALKEEVLASRTAVGIASFQFRQKGRHVERKAEDAVFLAEVRWMKDNRPRHSEAIFPVSRQVFTTQMLGYDDCLSLHK